MIKPLTKHILLLSVLVGLSGCEEFDKINANVKNGISYVSKVKAQSTHIQGITFDESGSLYVTSNKKFDDGEKFRIDEYTNFLTDKGKRNPVANLSGHGQGFDYIDGVFYYSPGSSSVHLYSKSFDKISSHTLLAPRSTWQTCGGDSVHYACVENTGMVHVYAQPLQIENEPLFSFQTVHDLIVDSSDKKKKPVLQGVEVYKNFVITYRGGSTKGVDDYLWIDVFDMNTKELVYQKNFQAWGTRKVPEHFVTKQEAEGISVFEGNLYMGMTYKYVHNPVKTKLANAIVVDKEILGVLDSYNSGADIKSLVVPRNTSLKDAVEALKSMSNEDIISGASSLGLELNSEQVDMWRSEFSSDEKDKPDYNPFELVE